MPFPRPTFDELRLRVRQDLMNRLPGTDAMLRWNNMRIIADVEAGTVHMLYGRLVWSFNQMFPDTAETEFLDRWAGIWGVSRRPPSAAFGPVQFAANPGTTYPVGSIMSRSDDVQFAVTASVSEVDGLVTVNVEAVVPGAIGDTAEGTELTAVNTVTGIAPFGTVQAGGLVGGSDNEPDEILRERLLLRIQSPPAGGNASDYVQWALEVPGVTRAWSYPLEMGAGTVTVRFMMDGVRSAAQGIPEAGDVALVKAHIDAIRPVTAILTVAAPVALPVDINVNDLELDTPETRVSVNIELLDFFVRTAAPGREIYPSEIISAINAAPGVQRFRMLAPITSVAPLTHQIPILGTLIFT